jgi:hypothetical protein
VVVVVEEDDHGVDLGGGGFGGECNCSYHEIMPFVPDVVHSINVTTYQK